MKAALPLLCALILAGCATSDVEGRDSDRLFPTVRAVFDLNEPLEGQQAEPRGRFRHGLEVELTGTAGEVNLDSGVGAADYTVVHGSTAYRFGVAAPRIQAFGLVGLAIDRIDLSGNPLANTDESFFGPMFGFEGRLRLREWVSPYFRATGFLMEEGSYANQFEAGLMFTPAERYEAFLAYRRWNTEYGNAAPSGRDLDLEWRGVVLGFGVQL